MKLYQKVHERIPSDEMVRAAKVIARSKEVNDHRLGILFLRTAFFDGGVDAVVALAASIYLKKGKTWGRMTPSDEVKVLDALKKAALKQKHPEAMNVLGQIYKMEERLDDAFQVFRAAMTRVKNVADGKIDEDDSLPNLFSTEDVSTVVPVWIMLGEEYLRRGNFKEAIETYEEGAIRADDPYAYFCAGRVMALKEKTTSPKWIHYMTKAAISGHARAAFMLGDFYASKARAKRPILVEPRKRGNPLTFYDKILEIFENVKFWASVYRYKHLDPYFMEKSTTFKLSREWYGLAARGGINRAQLNLLKLSAENGHMSLFLRDWAAFKRVGFQYSEDGEMTKDAVIIKEEVEALFEKYRANGELEKANLEFLDGPSRLMVTAELHPHSTKENRNQRR